MKDKIEKQTEYNHLKIEKKWQKFWEKNEVYKTTMKSKKPKCYVLDMFPYPSGTGLHVGHPRGYIASDVYSRLKRMQGFNILHPMGYDAFGLPAEQYAIQHKIHPRKAVEENIKTFRRQLDLIGLSYDWTRSVNTTDPEYYKWTQWIFLKLYESWYDNKKQKAEPIKNLIKIFEKDGNKNINASCSADVKMFTAVEWKTYNDLEKQNILMKYRLAYEGFSEVNWCPSMGTVLANDEITNGPDGKPVSERGGYKVEKKMLRQWFLRITAYADRLLEGLEKIDWSPNIKEIQKNWIGRSSGAMITFQLQNFSQIYADFTCLRLPVRILTQTGATHRQTQTNAEKIQKKLISDSCKFATTIEVFTTRPDTLFGVTYLVLAPENKLVQQLKPQIKNWKEVEKYIKEIKNKADIERTAEGKEKTGVKLEGIFVINPVNNEEVPVFIADYVLANYGTGAVMAVPSHDERDYAFAMRYNLPVRHVISPQTNADLTCLRADTHRQTQTDTKNKCFIDSGIMINSEKFDGKKNTEIMKEITEFVGGKIVTKYKMRDAVFARQRYWGEPIPLIHKKDGTIISIDE
ncbi:MAG: leucine--tRNA ligase, partial [Flavobacterium sp.]|nr:leucine--tRNA ligase [Flavobacterium sp.]